MATSKGTTNGEVKDDTVALVTLADVPKIVYVALDAFKKYNERDARRHPPGTPDNALAATLKQSVRAKHAAPVKDPTRARRVERARRKRGQEMRHRYETVLAERNALATRVRELERKVTMLEAALPTAEPPVAPEPAEPIEIALPFE